MGKPNKEHQSVVQKRKDNFFKKTNAANQPKPRQKLDVPEEIKPSSSGTTNSFFIRPEEKSKILKEKQARKLKKVDSKILGRNAEDKQVVPKKPFDKKKWRLQKYSKKYKIQQWEEKRKKAVLREYYKTVDPEDPSKFNVQKIYEQDDVDEDPDKIVPSTDQDLHDAENDNNYNKYIREVTTDADTFPNIPSKKKLRPQKKAELEYRRLQEEKEKQKEDKLKKRAEKTEALKQYKAQKLEKYKKLNRKTKKGQPIMKHRMEMLLEKIQQSV